ncbi:MAG TPA: kelch repeat-containing protein [Vicinamibacterales bacterium]|jgi:N-acetylneuraminic acid mutarotase|nr:kelch repeat-containing protein [Vicinamibacterales bacterium]
MRLTIRRVSAVAAVAALILAGSSRLPAQGRPLPGGYRWSTAAPFPEPQEELYALTIKGKVYVVGGFGKTGDPQGLMYEYDPGADRWTKKKSMPAPVHHQAQTAFEDKIYTFGGCMKQLDGPGSTDKSWEYDPAADSWKALAPLPVKMCAAEAEQVGGKIYVVGGLTTFDNGNGTRVTGMNQVYDPRTNTWEQRTPMPTARNHHFSAVVNGKIYMIGGRLGSGGAGAASATDVNEEYDPATNVWTLKTPMPTPRSGGGDAVYNGRIIAAGGELTTRQFSATFRAVEAYDPETDTWSILPSMPQAKHGGGVAVVGNRLYLASGALTVGRGFGADWVAATGQHDVLELPPSFGTSE